MKKTINRILCLFYFLLILSCTKESITEQELDVFAFNKGQQMDNIYYLGCLLDEYGIRERFERGRQYAVIVPPAVILDKLLQDVEGMNLFTEKLNRLTGLITCSMYDHNESLLESLVLDVTEPMEGFSTRLEQEVSVVKDIKREISSEEYKARVTSQCFPTLRTLKDARVYRNGKLESLPEMIVAYTFENIDLKENVTRRLSDKLTFDNYGQKIAGVDYYCIPSPDVMLSTNFDTFTYSPCSCKDFHEALLDMYFVVKKTERAEAGATDLKETDKTKIKEIENEKRLGEERKKLEDELKKKRQEERTRMKKESERRIREELQKKNNKSATEGLQKERGKGFVEGSLEGGDLV